MTHLTRANVPFEDDNLSALTVSMKWQTSVAEAVKLMLSYGSNKSLNFKCAKWFDQFFLKKKEKTSTRATKMNAKILHPKHETNTLS